MMGAEVCGLAKGMSSDFNFLLPFQAIQITVVPVLGLLRELGQEQ